MITFTIVAIIGIVVSFLRIRKWWKERQKIRFDEETGEIKLPFKHIKFPQEYWLGTPADDESKNKIKYGNFFKMVFNLVGI
jgi:hypothetical protein